MEANSSSRGLWCPSSGVTIEGEFGLGWIGRLSPDQLDFVGLLLRARNNLQRLATELGVSYNTARARLDEIVDAVGGHIDAEEADRQEPSEPASRVSDGRVQVLEALAAGEITHDEALRYLKR